MFISLFTKNEFAAQCALFSKIRYSRDFISDKLSQMLLDDCVFSFDLDISCSNQKYFCAIQSRKNGCIFFKSCHNSSQVFLLLLLKQWCAFTWIASLNYAEIFSSLLLLIKHTTRLALIKFQYFIQTCVSFNVNFFMECKYWYFSNNLS